MEIKFNNTMLQQKLFNSSTNSVKNFVGYAQIPQFKGKSLEELSQMSSKEDKFTNNNGKTIISEQRAKDKIIRVYSDGTKEIISNKYDSFFKRYYVEIDKYDKNGDYYSSVIQGDNGTYESTLVDSKERIFKAESFVKSNPNKSKVTLTYKKTRDDIEILEATVKQPNGHNYSLKKETNEYGFETGKYILTKINKNGKTESQKVWAFEIKPETNEEKLQNSQWFKVKDLIFLTDIGLKGRI